MHPAGTHPVGQPVERREGAAGGFFSITERPSVIIKPKNWSQFQHYNRRSPPWIKLHRSLLDDYEFQRLHVASRALAPCLWLLASEHPEGHVKASTEILSFRLRLPEKEVETGLRPLIDNGFFEVLDDCKHDASALLARCLRGATPERERETETDKPKAPELPEWVPGDAWKAWLEVRPKVKAPNTPRALTLAIRELEKLRADGHDPRAVLEQSTVRGYRGLFPVDRKGHQEAAGSIFGASGI